MKTKKNELVVKGKTKLCGIEIPIVYGGFGENQKVILAKTASEIHDRPLKEVNRLITNHIEDGYFEEGIDFIDLKNSVIEKHPLLEMGFSKQSISNSKNIYLLSQQGYTLLLKLMDSELARKQYKEVIRKYFMLQEAIKYLTKDELDRLVSRNIGIIRRNKETETIAKLIRNGDFKGQKYNPYSIVTNATYDILYGMYAKEIKEHLNLKQRDNLRDFLSKKDLDEIKEIEDFVHFLVKMDKNWKEIVHELMKAYPDTIVPEKEETSIKELKKIQNVALLES